MGSTTGPAATAGLISVLVASSLYLAAGRVARTRLPASSYLGLTWLFFVCFAGRALVGLPVAIWVLALLCFRALREYFSLVDIRLQDRLGLLGAYLAIPFMIYFIQIRWYGMFIVSIPVYAFLAIPLLVTLGGPERRGTVFSTGAINLGLFLFVYCLGHVGYLMHHATWAAAMLVLGVAACDAAAFLVRARTTRVATRLAGGLLLPVPVTVPLSLGLSPWTGIPAHHAVVLGLLIPALALAGRHTIGYVKEDLGVRSRGARPGQGQILDHLGSLFFAAPVVFHYVRYYLT